MNNIRIDYQGLITKSSELREYKEEYDKILKKITQKIESLSETGIWYGKDNEVFNNQFKEYIQKFDIVSSLIEDYSTTLSKISYVYEKLENNYCSKEIL